MNPTAALIVAALLGAIAGFVVVPFGCWVNGQEFTSDERVNALLWAGAGAVWCPLMALWIAPW